MILFNFSLSCAAHGVPVSWKDGDADCQEPCIIPDEQLTSELMERRPNLPSGTDAPFCPMTLFYCQMNIAKVLTQVLDVVFGLHKTSYSRIHDLDQHVENYLQNIVPKTLRPSQPGFDPNLEPLLLVMRSFYKRIILFLHRPFVGRSHERPQFKSSRDRAVTTALSIIENQVQASSTINILFENHWAIKPMIAHSLFSATITLALDLYTYPIQPDPEPLLRALLAIHSHYFSLTKQFPSSQRLYNITTDLIRKVWRKLSHKINDPSLILSMNQLETGLSDVESQESRPIVDAHEEQITHVDSSSTLTDTPALAAPSVSDISDPSTVGSGHGPALRDGNAMDSWSTDDSTSDSVFLWVYQSLWN